MVLPLLGVAFPVVALAQAAEKTAASVKTALFKDIATYPEQNVAAQVVAANQVQISAQIAGVVKHGELTRARRLTEVQRWPSSIPGT